MDKLGIEPVDVAHDTALKPTIQPTSHDELLQFLIGQRRCISILGTSTSNCVLMDGLKKGTWANDSVFINPTDLSA